MSRKRGPGRFTHEVSMESTTHINRQATMTIRTLGPADREAIEAIAARDSRPVPFGTLLGAEVEGKLLAAISVESGAMVSDPFARTAELRQLLELRVSQISARDADASRGRTGRRVRSALPAAAPGAGGRLLRLPVRLT